jgi:hypothetical protein
MHEDLVRNGYNQIADAYLAQKDALGDERSLREFVRLELCRTIAIAEPMLPTASGT